MKKLILFPLISIVLFVLAYRFVADDWPALLHGERANGHVVAQWVTYDDQPADLLVDLRHELVLERANGSQVHAWIEQGGIVRIDGAIDPNETASLEKTIQLLARGSVAEIMRFLQRESDVEEDTRIVRCVRTETASLFRKAGELQDYEVIDGVLTAVLTSSGVARQVAEADRVVTTIEFRYVGGTEEAKEKKTDVTRTFSRTLNGEPVEAPAEDFFYYPDDFRYVFQAVYTLETEAGWRVYLADIGARYKPRKGHKLYELVRAAWLPESPEIAVLVAQPARMKDMEPLDKLNFFFEETFGRWFWPLTLSLIGLVYAVFGGILISLAVKPPETENADTVAEEQV